MEQTEQLFTELNFPDRANASFNGGGRFAAVNYIPYELLTKAFHVTYTRFCFWEFGLHALCRNS